MNKYHVVIIDDEKPIVEGLKAFIDWEAEGFCVAGTALNGEEGVREAIRVQADVVLTDMRMPLLTGSEVIQKIKEVLPDCTLIALSGYNSFDYVQGAVNNGASCYLLKPVQEEDLIRNLRKIKKTLDEKHRTAEEMNFLRHELADLQPALREHSLRKIVENASLTAEEIEIKWKRFHPPFSPEHFCVLVAEPDCLERKYRSDTETMTYQDFRISEAIINFCVQSGNAVSYRNSKGQTVVVANVEKKEEARQTAERLLEKVRAELGESVSVGLGRIQNQLKGLNRSYKEAEHALEYRLLQGEGAVIAIEEITFSQDRLVYPTEEEQAMLHSLDTGNAEEAKKHLQKIFEGISTSKNTTPQFISTICTAIGAALAHSAVSHGISIGNRKGDLSFSIRELNEKKSLGEMRQYLEEVISDFADHILQEQEIQHRGVVGEIQKYVEEHYMENISLEFIEKKFFVNASYLSFLFKKKIGVNYIDYLTEIRMQKAKQLLARPKLKIYEVSEKVGYNSSRYFSQLFEKKVGLTPTQYRNQALNEKETE